MDDSKHAVALLTVETAVSTALSSVLQAVESSADVSAAERASKRRRLSLSPLEIDEIPFKWTFGMTRESFDCVCALVSRHWLDLNRPIDAHARSQLSDRVAVTIYYLTHCSDLAHVAETFNMTTTAATRYVWQVVDVLLCDAVKGKFFTFPTSYEDWSKLSADFEAICGYPNCCLAIGGMLVEIETPRQWEGWYCSKDFAAENVQLVVDAQCRVRSMDVRPGGITDKETLRYSRFGRSLAQILPEGKHIVGHTGYSLSKFVVVPYPVMNSMADDERRFNYLQEMTQRVVKRTAEMIKKRFRILQSPLKQKTEDGDAATTKMAQIISTAIVLHNVLVDLDDLVEADSSMEDDTDEEDLNENSEDSDLDESMDEDIAAQRDRIKDYLYVNRDQMTKYFG